MGMREMQEINLKVQNVEDLEPLPTSLCQLYSAAILFGEGTCTAFVCERF